MDVDEAGVAPPTNEWMEAAQRAADTDGILENGPAKRQKVCNPMLHAHSPAPANPAQECTQKERVYPAESWRSDGARNRPVHSAKMLDTEDAHRSGALRRASHPPVPVVIDLLRLGRVALGGPSADTFGGPVLGVSGHLLCRCE